MLNKVIEFSIRNKLVIGLLTLGLIAWGVYNFFRLPIDAVPDITNNQVQVITISPSLAPQEVEQFITFPVETVMANIQDVTEIRSISRFGLSVVTIVFKDKTDILKARQMVSEQIKAAESQIPADYGKPEMMPITTGLGEIYQYVLQPKPGYEKVFSLYDLRSIQDWIVKRYLAGIPGIVEISSFGGLLKQYEVAINPRKLVGMNITIGEIYSALESNNQNSGGSYIEKRQDAYYIRTEGIVRNIDDIGMIVVKQVNGIPLLIRDIATVKIGSAPRFGAMTKDGKGETVGGITLMLKGANSAAVVGRVKERIEKVRKMLPEGLDIVPYLDRSELISKTINTVTKNLVEGGLIVIFVLVLLLGNFRSGLVVASVIPLSMLFAISMMNVFGVSANLMSLGAIDFGLIVDGSVIVVEGIMHQLQKRYNFQIMDQKQMDDLIYDSGTRVGRSASFGVLIILIVYVPIFAFTGIEGKMFRPMAQTVSFALIGALILSFTYVPMISSVFLKKKISFREGFAEKIMKFLHREHDRALSYALKRPVMVVGSALVIVVISFWVFSRMGGEFLPTLEEGDLACQMTLPPGTSLSQSIATTTKVEQILMKQFPEVKHIVSKIGSAEIPTDPMAIEDADIMIIMKPKDDWTSARTREEMSDKMKAALEVLPGVAFDFSQPIQLRFNELMTGVKSDVAVKIFGEDLDVLYDKANEAAEVIRKIRGAGDIRVEQITGLPQLVVHYRRDRIAQYGLTISDINSIVRTSFAGQATGLVFEGEKRYDLVIRLDEEFRNNIEALENLRVNRPDEELILLSQVADIRVTHGPMLISREETRRRTTIGINVRNRDVESFITEVNEKLEKNLKLPPGYLITYGGQFENLKTAKRTSAIAVPVALAAIFVLLFFAFSSFRQSVMIFTAIPLAAVGGIWALVIRGMPFSISGGVGFIALFGIAVLNGIVLISHYNRLEKEGIADTLQRVIQGTSDRLRPVVMTSLVAALGFVPMAVSTAAGAEVQKPLATVVIGGIITSSILTLIVLPVLYLTFNEGMTCYIRDIRKKRKMRKNRTILPVILVFLAVSSSLFAQDPVTVKRLSMEDAVKIARMNNPDFKTLDMQVLAEKKRIKSGVDLASPSVSLETGQINTAANDHKVLISQEFEFPMVYAEQALAQKSKYRASEILAEIKKSELAGEVRSRYMNWRVALAKRDILEQIDSLFRVLNDATDIQYRAGHISQLSALMAQSRLYRAESQLKEAEAEIAIATEELRVIMNSEEAYLPPPGDPGKLALTPGDSLAVEDLLNIRWLDQTLDYRKHYLRQESWSAVPSFTVGWFNQSIDGQKGFTGWQYGINIPLWFWAPAGKIQSARIERDIARTNLEYEKIKIRSLLSRYKKEMEKLETQVKYYETVALKQSGLMIDVAGKSYKAGEIDLLQMLYSMNDAFTVRVEYLDLINRYNQAVINIQKITGR